MKEGKYFNYDYLKQVREIPLFFMASFFKTKRIRNPKRILIINPCLIGDIAASLPAIRAYIKKRKYAKIDIMVPLPMKSVLEKVKGINKVYVTKSAINRKIENIKIPNQEMDELMRNHYDSVLVIRMSEEAYDVLKKIKTRNIKISPFKFLKYALHLSKVLFDEGKRKQYQKANFEWIGERYTDMKFNDIFNFSKKDYAEIKKIPEMRGREKKIIIHAGRGWKKSWESKKWVELVSRINKMGNYKFIFIGGDKKEEREFIKIQNSLNFRIYSLIKKINLAQLLLIMRSSNYFIGIDSGPRNIAHLADLRSIGLLGPGPKHFMPTNKKDIIINKSDCRCTHLFCLKRKECMKKISVNDVFEAFQKLEGKGK